MFEDKTIAIEVVLNILFLFIGYLLGKEWEKIKHEDQRTQNKKK